MGPHFGTCEYPAYGILLKSTVPTLKDDSLPVYKPSYFGMYDPKAELYTALFTCSSPWPLVPLLLFSERIQVVEAQLVEDIVQKSHVEIVVLQKVSYLDQIHNPEPAAIPMCLGGQTLHFVSIHHDEYSGDCEVPFLRFCSLARLAPYEAFGTGDLVENDQKHMHGADLEVERRARGRQVTNIPESLRHDLSYALSLLQPFIDLLFHTALFLVSQVNLEMDLQS
jgi:hypothetical protein